MRIERTMEELGETNALSSLHKLLRNWLVGEGYLHTYTHWPVPYQLMQRRQCNDLQVPLWKKPRVMALSSLQGMTQPPLSCPYAS